MGLLVAHRLVGFDGRHDRSGEQHQEQNSHHEAHIEQQPPHRGDRDGHLGEQITLGVELQRSKGGLYPTDGTTDQITPHQTTQRNARRTIEEDATQRSVLHTERLENTDLVQIRPAFGGNIMAQIITPNTRPQFCTARYKVFTEPKPTEEAKGEIVTMAVTEKMLLSGIEVISSTAKPKDIDIAEADVVVAVGRGASSEAMRGYAKELADLLGGVVACTRPLVEANIFDAKHQIGLSGRTVKPKLIFCLGISGAVQFAAGMKSSDCIVAINSDPAAPIFDVAHYCVKGDVAEILPKLIAKIKEGRNV